MPVLKNVRHEAFAIELAQGKAAHEAYVLAGYKYNDGNCIRLKGDERILRRVEELRNKVAQRAEVTIESLTAEAEEARVAAMAAGQISAAVAAIKEKGVLTGNRIERRETGSPGEFDWMERATEQQLAVFIETGEVPVDPGKLN